MPRAKPRASACGARQQSPVPPAAPSVPIQPAAYGDAITAAPLRVVVKGREEALPLADVLAAAPSGVKLRFVDNDGQEYLFRRSLADRALDRPRAPGVPRVLQATYLRAGLRDLRRALRHTEFLIVVVCERTGLSVLKRRVA